MGASPRSRSTSSSRPSARPRRTSASWRSIRRTSRRRRRSSPSIARARSGRACSPPTRSCSARRRRPATATRRWRCIARSSSCARRSWARSRWRSPGRPRPTSCAPTDAGLQKNLERLAAEAEAWEELAEIYQAEVQKEPDEARKIERYRQLARIALTRLYKPEEARRHFEEVLARAPEDTEALTNLEQIFTQAGNYKELLEIYRKREARATDPQRRLEMLFKIAWIEEEQIGDPVAASATYRKIIDADKTPATQTRALRALEKLNAARGDAAGMADVLERQLALVDKKDEDTQLELSQRLGELYELNLNQPDRALEHYRAAFALSSVNKPTVAALERWLKPEVKADDRVSVAHLLVPVYDHQLALGEEGAAKKLVDALEIVRAAEKDPKAELALLRRLMDLSATQLGDAARAYGYGARVFERAPADAENRRMMAQLADQLDKPDDWAVQLSVAETAADKRGEDEAGARSGMGARPAVRRAARHAQRRRDRRTSACSRATSRTRTRRSRSCSSTASTSAGRICARCSRARSSARSIRKRGCRCSIRSAISTRACSTITPAATRDYVEVLEIDPGSQRAFRALERLYIDRGELARARRAVGAAHSVRRDRRRGGGDAGVARASDLPARRAARQPARRSERRGRSVRGRRSSIERAPRGRAQGARGADEAARAAPAHRQGARAALSRGRGLAEAGAGARRAARSGRGARGGGAVVAAGRAAGGAARARGSWRWRPGARRCASIPADKKIRTNVERLATLLGRQAELAAAWEEAFLASDPSDLALRGELLESAAELYEHELGDIDKARATWKRLLDLDATNLHTARPAAARWRGCTKAPRIGAPSSTSCIARPSGRTSADEKKELLFRIGRIEEELLVDPAAAIGTYREILDDDAARSARARRAREAAPGAGAVAGADRHLEAAARARRSGVRDAARSDVAHRAAAGARARRRRRGHRRLPRDPRRAARRSAGARRAGAAVRSGQSARPICSRSSSCGCSWPTRRARPRRRRRCGCRSRACSTASRATKRRSSTIARCSTPSRATRRRARASRSTSTIPICGCAPPRCSSRTIRARASSTSRCSSPSCGPSTRPIRGSASCA